MDAGLHGLLLTPPWYFRDASDDGLFAWFSAFFADPEWRTSLLTSFRVALSATCIAVVTGTLAALGLRGLPKLYERSLELPVLPHGDFLLHCVIDP